MVLVVEPHDETGELDSLLEAKQARQDSHEVRQKEANDFGSAVSPLATEFLQRGPLDVRLNHVSDEDDDYQ